MGAFALGCGLAWTSPVLPDLTDCDDGCAFPGDELTDNEASWVGSTYTLGAMASGLATGFLLDRQVTWT